jgi:predicted nucleotidyltransferase
MENIGVFSVEERDRVRDRILEIASSDPRIVGAAAVGSLAQGEGDRWSDLDLMFAVADDASFSEVMKSWTVTIAEEFKAVQLFDLPRGSIVYRVFLLPTCLELDLSFTPASEFAPAGSKVRLFFGEAVEEQEEVPTSPEEPFGYAVHHAMHARIAMERGRYWLAAFWIGEVRNYALILACRRRGLDGSYGRDFDRLPTEVLASFENALVGSLEPTALFTALENAVDGLLRESGEVSAMAERVEPQLREMGRFPPG